MKKLISIAVVSLITLGVIMAGQGIFNRAGADFPIETKTPPDKSVTIDKLADGALSDPRIFNMGFVPDTATIAIIFDDGHDDWYDSILVWNEELGFCFGIAMPRDKVGGADKLTATQLSRLYDSRNEVLNHFWAGNSNYLMSHLTGDTLDAVVNDSYRYFVDTLGVGIPDLPGEMGGAYGSADLTIPAVAKVAENHYYALYAGSNYGNHYESLVVPAKDRVNSNLKWWKFWGSMTPYQADTVHTGSWGPTSADIVFRDINLVYPHAVANRWACPVGYTNGPGPTDGTIKTYQLARIAVRHVIHNGAAAFFSFHTDSTALNGTWSVDPDSCAWFSEWLWWLKSMQDSGLITVHRPYEIARDYVMRPPKEGVNLFPNPDLQKFSGWGKYATPNGLLRGEWNSSGNNGWDCVALDSTGFRDSPCGGIYPQTGAGAEYLVFPIRVPSDCYIWASYKANACSAFATPSDSIEAKLYFQPMTPNIEDDGQGYGSGVSNGAAWHHMYEGSSMLAKDTGGADDVIANIDWGAAGYNAQSRWLYGDENVWKEIINWQYITSNATILVYIGFDDAPPTRNGTNYIKIDDVTVMITRPFSTTQ